MVPARTGGDVLRAEAAAARAAIGADRRQIASWRGGQRQELLGDAQKKLRAIRDEQLVVQALDVRVDRARRDVEVGGNGEFGLVVEGAAYDLQFPIGESEAASYLPPRLGREHGRIGGARRLAIAGRTGFDWRASPGVRHDSPLFCRPMPDRHFDRDDPETSWTDATAYASRPMIPTPDRSV